MEKFMNVETICLDKKFINSQMRNIPKYFYGFLSKEEIKSDLYFTICKLSNSRVKIATNNLFFYIRTCFINTLKKSIRDKQYYAEKHCSLDYAYNKTYEVELETNVALCAYLQTLPEQLLNDLTEFVLGKKNKEEIIANPSLKKINVNRVLEKLDYLLG